MDHAERILPFEDEDISDFVDDNLRRHGVEIFHSAMLRQHQEPREDRLEAILDFADGHCQGAQRGCRLDIHRPGAQPGALNLDAAGISPMKRDFYDR